MRPRWWIFVGALVLCASSLAWAAASGPDPFPTHWGPSGAADSWGPRGSALAMLGASAAGIAVLFGVLAAFAGAIPDRHINLPRAARAYWLTPDHRPALDALLQRFLITVGTAVLMLLAASAASAVAAPEGSPVLGVGVWCLVAVIAGSTGHLLWRLVRPPGR